MESVSGVAVGFRKARIYRCYGEIQVYTYLAADRTNFCSESLYVQLGDYLNVAGTFALYYSSECVCTVYSDAVDCLHRNQQVHTNRLYSYFIQLLWRSVVALLFPNKLLFGLSSQRGHHTGHLFIISQFA